MDSREQTSWVFRHIGPPPTIAGAVEVVELKQGATAFGRGGSSDVYIDSLLLHNFISRCHAVVVGERNDDGHLHFLLHNHGLNGTYVNDVRIGKIHPLQEGDKIIFGHKNGYKVKVGETAEQPDSEFQFIFERRQPSKSAVTPLQEHRQQEEISGDTILSSGDCTEPPVYTPRRNGPHTPDKAKDSSRKRDKSLLCENAASEGHSRSPSRVPQTESQKSKPFKADHNSDSGKKGRNVPVKESLEQKNETSKEPTKENGGSDEVLSRIEEGGVAKENKARSKSPWRKKSVDEEKNLPSRRRDDEGDGKTELSRRLSGDSPKTELPRKPGECEQNGSLKRQSEDSVPASAQQNIKQDSSGCVSIRGETEGSVSTKREQSAVGSSIHGSLDNVKSKSPKQIDRKKLPRASDQTSSPRYRDRSKSPRQPGRSRLPNSEGSEHRSRSPLDGESAQSRLVSPKDKVSEKGSRLSAGESRVVQGRSRSPKPSFARKRPVSPELDNSSSSDSDSSRSSERRSVSPEKKERRSSSVYDEPPVLSPEYVVKTPSPCGFIDRTYDEEYDDINDIDKESLLYSVPPTPGHSLRDLSPSPHHSRRDCSPETKMGGMSGWERNRDNDRSPYRTFQSRNKDPDIEFSRNQTEKLGKRSESRSQKNYNRPKDKSVERDFFFKSRRKGEGGFSDQKRKKSMSSRTERERAEPDSTTVHRDRNGIDADSADSFKRHTERSDEKCAENKHGWLDAEKDTYKHKEKSDEKCSENKHGWLDAEKDTKRHTERSDEKCSENKSGGLDAEKDTKRHTERSNEKCSENKSRGLDAEKDTKKTPTRRSNDRDGRHHDYRNKTKGKSKDCPLPATEVGRNVFEEFTSSDRHDSGLHSSGKKRRNSSGDDSSNSKSRFKSSKPHPKPYKSFGEKENGPTPGKESSSNHTGYTDRNRDKLQSDGKLLKDVRVSVRRVGVYRTGQSKNRGTDRKQIQSKSAAEDGVGTYRDQNKQPSQPSKGEKTASGGDKVRRGLSTDTSLFALELERLSTVQRKEKNKSPRDKTLPVKEEQLTSSQTKNQKSKGRVKKKLPSEQPAPERGREKSRHTSGDRHASGERQSERKSAASVSSRSVTPDPSFSTGESEKLKPGRKIATRRPRQVKDDTDQDEGKPGRDPDESNPGRSSGKKPRQRRKTTSKTKGSEGNDDECLEDGVVWYEEDTCESEACFRPADRRVQWVCCDDCDKWYHTVCVGIINLEDLKDEDYHCGCTDD